jgi:hypothetical protein
MLRFHFPCPTSHEITAQFGNVIRRRLFVIPCWQVFNPKLESLKDGAHQNNVSRREVVVQLLE